MSTNCPWCGEEIKISSDFDSGFDEEGDILLCPECDGVCIIGIGMSLRRTTLHDNQEARTNAGSRKPNH